MSDSAYHKITEKWVRAMIWDEDTRFLSITVPNGAEFEQVVSEFMWSRLDQPLKLSYVDTLQWYRMNKTALELPGG